MTKKAFKLPPLSPLIGTDLINFFRVTSGYKINPKFWIKYILTGLIILILTPLRWFEKWHFRKVNNVKIENPIFILGHWRSGTTHLHNMLCQSPKAGYVTTYQTVFTQYLASGNLLRPFMRLIMPEKRPSDNVELNVDYPQEDEFALLNMTSTSFYNFFYYPEKTKEYFNRYVKFNRQEDEAWKKAYNLLLKKTKFTHPQSSYLVIKNPVNTGRVPILQTMYPDCRFIHIYRNPYIVFLSTKKFLIELFPTLWFNEISTSAIEELILQNYTDFMDAFYETDFDHSAIFEIKFEDFENNALEKIESIYNNFQIPFYEKAKPFFESYLKAQKTYRKNKYRISKREVLLVQERWGKYLKRWNYELPDNMEVIT